MSLKTNTITIDNNNIMFIYLIQCIFYFPFTFFFALYNSTQNMDEFLRMKMEVSRALQSNFHISHNATCFFKKKNFAKPFFKICHKLEG